MKNTRKIKLLGLTILAFLMNTGMTKPVQEGKVPLFGYKVINTYPHDPEAFTQGLFIKNDHLYESTGRYGTSTIRRVDLETGEVLQSRSLPDTFFGEGITDWGDEIISLTWKQQRGFLWDFKSFEPRSSFQYFGEGWGITHNDTHLIVSNGTPTLAFLDPKTKLPVREIYVTANGRPISLLNELEWVNGEIYANVWQTDFILRIDPKTGKVIGIIDLTGILKVDNGPDNVLNGIAIDKDGKLYVTGKLWPKLFEIELVAK